MQELSANTVAFISCRNRLTKVLVGAAREEKESKGGGGQVRLLNVNMPFEIDGGHGHGWHGQTSIPGKQTDGIGCGWILVGQSSRPCKRTGAHLHVSRASDPFLQCKMHYIFYVGVGTLLLLLSMLLISRSKDLWKILMFD